MRFPTLGCALVLALFALPLRAADSPYEIKVQEGAAPPADVAEPIRKLLAERSIQFLDKGELVYELWLRKEVPAKATDAQIKNGLTYQEVPETTILGVIRVARENKDYRKQKLKVGSYTLRLANQPMDGDHMGTAPYSEFCLVSPASVDKTAGSMEAKHLHELSAKTTGSHPGVLLLFPGKGAGDQPTLANKGTGHWVLLYRQAVTVGDKKAVLDVGLTLVGASPSA
jgi:hypothetical protein